MSKGFTLWNTNKGKTYSFQDRMIKDFVFRSGTGFLIHKYIGPELSNGTVSSLGTSSDSMSVNELTIQDVLVQENRDRKYDPDIVELIGCYQIVEPGFDLSQFGLMLSGDTILVEFHLNDHTQKLGRKLMAGDVLEPVHLRDDLPLDQNAGPIPKYYVVQDCFRPATGYGPTWFAHLWRVKCIPIMDTQEYRDILHNKDKQNIADPSWTNTFGSEKGTGYGVTNKNNNNTESPATSTLQNDLLVTKLVSDAAKEAVRRRSFFIRHLYMRPADKEIRDGLIKWVLDNDAVPPDFTGDFIPSGDHFPEEPEDGDYFVRTDYEPDALFKREQNVWRKVQDNWRIEWVPAHRVLQTYLDNNNITVIGPTDADTFPEQQALSNAVLPSGYFLPDKKKD